MRRVVVCIVLLALVLAGCGGTPADTTVGDPPQSKVIEASGNPQIDKLVADWKTVVPTSMKDQLVKEPIEEKVYQSTASLEEIDGSAKNARGSKRHSTDRLRYRQHRPGDRRDRRQAARRHRRDCVYGERH